jgi:hypothetical protein
MLVPECLGGNIVTFHQHLVGNHVIVLFIFGFRRTGKPVPFVSPSAFLKGIVQFIDLRFHGIDIGLELRKEIVLKLLKCFLFGVLNSIFVFGQLDAPQFVQLLVIRCIAFLLDII